MDGQKQIARGDTTVVEATARRRTAPKGSWTDKYGERHRQVPITGWPAGFKAPEKVRIYRRNKHFLLQWWEPAARQNLSTHVDGDLVDAIAEARRIDQRLLDVKSSGKTRARLRHEQFVEAYRADLLRRANAGEIRPGTVVRYGNALNHYLTYITSAKAVAAAGPYATGVNRTAALNFSAHLTATLVSPNGSQAAEARRMLSPGYVVDVVRGLYAWGSDPDRGNLLPESFRNPFATKSVGRTRLVPDLFGHPDITITMTADFLGECDLFQLRMFTPLIFFGLRAAEPCYLFFEYVRDGWLSIPCEPELDYVTKGRRSKTFPLIAPLQTLLTGDADSGECQGLIFVRRSVFDDRERPPLRGKSLQDLIREYQRRLQRSGEPDAKARERLRIQVLEEAGSLNYDSIEHEFRSIAGRLKWPKEATLKDFRHGFATSLANAGVPDPYRKYLMGQRTDRAAIHGYTHLDQVRGQYLKAVETQWPKLVQIVKDRLAELGVV